MKTPALCRHCGWPAVKGIGSHLSPERTDMAKTHKAPKAPPKPRGRARPDVRRFGPRRTDDEPAPLPVEAFVGRGRRAQAAVNAALDVRMRQTPTGDRDDPPDPIREDDPRFDGKAEKEEAAATPKELGPIYLPSPSDAHRVLGELAALYHERFDTQQRHDALKTQLRQVAGELEKLSTRIAERIRVATHRTGLPLFADEEAEA
jgi:hypothetical protein